MSNLYLNGDEIENIFKKHIKTTVYSFSIKTLFSERMSRKINYHPYYQRNYVWDTAKATFFIESILLGTDIPPLIFFNNGKDIEVVDGRQRYETIKRFKEGDIKLSSKGLTKLMQLKNFSFSKLDRNIQDIFDDAKIRIFEFEIINEPKLDPILEDKVKKEIFRRYNSGITPLNKAELDNANYDDDEITNILKNKIKDKQLLQQIGESFLSKDTISLENDSAKILQFLRKYLILSQFPINTYASGSNRTETIEILYTFINDNTEDKEKLCDFLIDTLNDTFRLIKYFSSSLLQNNRYINECILWAIFILKEEEINYDNLYSDKNIKIIESILAEDISVFQAEGSHYYKAVIGRYQKVVDAINKIIKFDFSLYFKNDNFNSKIKKIVQSEDDLNLKLDELSSLRVQKPDASLIPVDELINDLESNRYLIRPSYQRQEKINIFKASAIIESIILGINLPPIFIFKNEKGIKEVVDGQQRILSILGFIGKKYLNESGELVYAKNNSFKLKRLKLLKDDYNNKSYNDLEFTIKDKILDFKLSVIEIDSKLNTNFDPVDLFIRLNNKPYPIKDNSFEMWNSYIDKEVIEKIKCLTNTYIDWFFIKQKNKQSDRMLNEELITILAYLRYNYTKKNKNSLGFYKRAENVNCRISDKKAITSLLEKLTISEIEKIDFIECIDYISNIIEILKTKLDNNNLKKSLDLLLNNDSTNYKRYLVNFYLLFEILQRLATNDNLNQINYEELQSKMNSIRKKLNNPFESTAIDNVQEYFISYLDNLAK
ncbi:hypothetical protein CP965_03735 [Halarcobacter mediterraneus]|uniref:GmrSD restriction endonucleases N-terminal domain-containing protein n=1 Tax=Halarcobacter mediterraneus TaxID=2023153 RepID=A0A4Q1AXR0_9BACT|nr:DUF262 domain-containing protein [Halarcobacter mediterraneus]RXK14568.1 hypothetical protein CP965_03735 [Halarcobacter mediterraneus]